MTESISSPVPFAYQAQTVDGKPITGTVDAVDREQAQKLLDNLRLRVIELAPADRPPRVRQLRSEDFLAFNQQLAHLTASGLPVEHGLRLIAQDMRRGRLAETIKQLATELERGTSLEQAFEQHRGSFPPLYSRLISAGIRAGDLPGMLLNIGRHVELVQRLRAAIWRSAAYPLVVLVALAMVMIFLALWVVPQFQKMFHEMGVKLPIITQLLLMLPAVMPVLLVVIGVIIVAGIVIWSFLRATGRDRAAAEWIVLPMPLIGPVMRNNLIARWCDAVRLGVAAGLDLPAAIELGGDAAAWPSLRHDGDELIATIQSGQPIDSVMRTRLLPATVTAAMAAASSNQADLAMSLTTLADLYQQQAQIRLSLLPGLLTPILIIIVALMIGLVIAGLFSPFMAILQSMGV